MLVRSGVFLLCMVGSIQAQVYDDFPDCASVEISHDNFDQDCIDFCAPFQATSTDALNKTDTYISQVYECKCGAFDTGCYDEIILVDKTSPLPTCDAAGLDITSIAVCQEVCDLAGEPVDTKLSRDVNGKIKCFCQNGWGVCSDDPTCAQLQVFPGTVEEDCAELCGTDATTSITDEVEHLNKGANKNQTHLKVACSCDDVERCRDNILFSDYAFIKSCRETLGIKSADDCEDHCVGNGFTTGFGYHSESGFLNANCTCNSAPGDILACEDLPPSDVRNGGDNNSGSVGLTAAWVVVSFISIVTLLWI